MNVQTCVVQRLRSIIWHAIDNDLLETAEFTAERLMGVTLKNDFDSVYLYGIVLYKRGKYKTGLRVTANRLHVGCSYVFAKCASKLRLEKDGIEALHSTSNMWNVEEKDIENSRGYEYESTRRGSGVDGHDNSKMGPDSAVIFALLGKLYCSIGDIKESAIHHTQALKLNPFLWESYEQLCSMGVNLNAKSIFKPRTSLVGNSSGAAASGSGSISGANSVATPKSNSVPLAPMNPKTFFKRTSDASFDTKERDVGSTSAIFSTPRSKNVAVPDAPLRKHVRASNRHDITDSIPRFSRLSKNSGAQNAAGSAATVSSRLINHQSTPTSANNTFAKRDLRNKSSDTINSSRNSNILENANSSLYMRKKEYKDQAEFQLMTLYLVFARGLKAMSRYDCYKAIRIFNQLPDSHIETPWVLGKLGRLNFEIVNYQQAEEFFVRLRKLDRTRTEDMEYYSTLLWHLQKDVDLSFLAHELYEVNKACPQTWVAIGNLFSLQRETEKAIKCFHRAIQVDPKFAYAYTLQGHEYIFSDAYENALDSFRGALLHDQKHYNALYGIGMVYLKLGEYQKAEYHFRRASDINPVNVILFCCIGMVLEKQNKKQLALKQYQLATELQPTSPLALFKKAQLLYSLQDFEASLVEFEKLKSMAPDEASVHFLLGQLYKAVGRKSEAIKEFTVAWNLDPKGSQLIKEALEGLSEED